MLDEIYQDYVRTALAKGVSKPRILFVHVLRNALIPIVTNVVIAIPFLYTGNLLLENFLGFLDSVIWVSMPFSRLMWMLFVRLCLLRPFYLLLLIY